MASRHKAPRPRVSDSDPLWYKDAIIYELHVRAFADSDGDGIGDFNGLLGKLDYLQDLGVTALWLLPFYPSPLRDDGYDIADYTNVHPSYGTLNDFKRVLAAAHDRGLRVITELAINHTSNEHPWFQRARRSPKGSRYREFYVWSDTPERYGEARIIFEDFETSNWSWDPVASAYYWHRFYSHQPDLNFDNPEVQNAVLRVLDFWMDLGVDGMRLDAIPYLFEREGTNCENLPETHAFLKRLREHVDTKYQDRMLLAEANQWPDDAAAYFGDGDECHMNFHFPVMPRLFMSVQLESRAPIVDILQQTPKIPDSAQWALFLRNHDELTLEMVTDEDRDYMYRAYAEDPRMRVNVGIRRRLSPLLKLRSKVELMNCLLMSLPGTPVLYYGDEIGQGDNVYLGDRNGVRTPMQWSADRNAGFSRANPQRLYLPVIIDPEYHYEAINVEAQQGNSESLLWWIKRLIALRRQHPVFGRGGIEFLEPENPKVLCFVRKDENERVLVVANLSRHAQYVELNLAGYRGMCPVEMSGGTPFPEIGELPYLLTVGGYGCMWFLLQSPKATSILPTQPPLPQVEARSAAALLEGRPSRPLEQALRRYVQVRRWFRSKTRKIKSLHFLDQLLLDGNSEGGELRMAILEVGYESDLPERYCLPLGLARGELAQRLQGERPDACLARVRLGGGGKQAGVGAGEALLYDATVSGALATRLLSLFSAKRGLSGAGVLRAQAERGLRKALSGPWNELSSETPSLEQSNTTFFLGQELVLKLFRQLEAGENPDAEISRFLSAQRFPNVAEVLGTLEYDGPELPGATLGLLQRFAPNQGNAWDLTLEALRRAFEQASSLLHEHTPPSLPQGNLVDAGQESPPDTVANMIGSYIELARLLGRRTAELHLALASDLEAPAFRPEAFAGHYHRSLFQAAHDRLSRSLQLLRKHAAGLPASLQPLVEDVLLGSEALGERLASLQRVKVEAMRIRCHGDLHLGQVLYDGRDFIFIDFEGEPAVSLGVRRLKRSALLDVSGMLRSFHYASVRALQEPHIRPDDLPLLEPWAQVWCRWVSAAYLDAYLQRADAAPFLPKSRDAQTALIELHLIEKCAYELAYELNNRPAWLGVPLAGLKSLMQ